ncbi:hypothetical protein CCO03_05385 [Comamonas serinivorans]|uniref:Delta-60 repeat domain-containing protein n=1 Tax=Comamonas serinivorans TaxID=1082851 RepID=A0A1Y0EKL2_9BURK|nr:hypothetical protein [Comamonas serinivorans]ARU04185.1 hypothetical protein CCO03_05385 [Comamonas serinivorans]
MHIRIHTVKIALLGLALGLSACGGGDATPDPSPEPGHAPLAVDKRFGEQGSVKLTLAPHGGSVSRVLELPDGKLMLLGHRQLNTNLADTPGPYNRRRPATQLFAQRLLADGQLDTSFGDQGMAVWQVAGADVIDDAIALSDGTVALVALVSRSCFFVPTPYGCVVDLENQTGEYRVPHLQRLLADGRIDRSAAASGAVRLSGSTSRLTEANGQVLALSTASYARGGLFSWVLSRHAFNGQVDAGFGQNGAVVSRCETDGAAVRADGDRGIWVVGARVSVSYVEPPAEVGLCLERLTADGGPHARMPQPLQVPMGLNLSVGDVRVLSDGRVLVAGTGRDDTRALAYAVSVSPDGQPTNGFGQQGVATFAASSANATGGNYSASAFIGEAGDVLYTGRYAWQGDGAQLTKPLGLRFTAQGQLNMAWGGDGLMTEPLLASGGGALVLRDSHQRWLVQASDGAAEDAPSVVTLTRLHGDSR